MDFSGDNNSSGYANSFFGSYSGQNNSTGYTNSFFGNRSGQSNTTGQANSFYGTSAGNNNSIGYSNSFFGESAGRTNHEGNFNSFFGASAGRENINGLDNSFFGYESGKVNTAGVSNSFFGHKSGTSNQLGNSNSFFGASAGGENINGLNNSFFGYESGKMNTSGGSNSFFGHKSGISYQLGNSNSFFGANSALLKTMGENNSFFGAESGYQNISGSDNSFYGQHAGYSSFATSKSTLLGTLSDVNGDLDRAIAIGYNAIVACDNCAVLGGVGADKVKVGIGTTTPGGLLEIDAGGGFEDYLMLTSLAGSSGDRFVIKNDGNVGINEAVPTGLLEINTNGIAQDPIIVTSGAASPGDLLVVKNDGKIGIGTSSPQAFVHISENVSGGSTSIRHENNAAANVDNQITYVQRLMTTTDDARISFKVTSKFIDISDGSRTSSVAFSAANNGTLGERMTIKGNQVGINCQDPDHDLVIGGNSAGCNNGTFSEIDKGEAQFTVSSSRSLKENFELVEPSQILEQIKNTPVYLYDFIDGPKDKMGLIAEDFHQIFQRGTDKKINGNEVTMALWIAVQKLTIKVETLEAQLAASK